MTAEDGEAEVPGQGQEARPHSTAQESLTRKSPPPPLETLGKLRLWPPSLVAPTFQVIALSVLARKWERGVGCSAECTHMHAAAWDEVPSGPGPSCEAQDKLSVPRFLHQENGRNHGSKLRELFPEIN